MAIPLSANDRAGTDFLRSPQLVSESSSYSGEESDLMTALTANTSITTTNDTSGPPIQEKEIREAPKGIKKGDGAEIDEQYAPANDIGEDVDDLSDSDDSDEEKPAHESSIGHSPRRSAKPLEERLLKAPKQVKQILQYTQLMEDRVQALEAKMEAVAGSQLNRTVANAVNPDGASPNAPPSVAKPEPFLAPLDVIKVIPQIKRGGENSYKKKHTSDSDVTYLIDVWTPDESETVPEKLPQKIGLSANGASDDSPPKDRQSSVANHSSISGIAEVNLAATYRTPKRVRINSKRLLAELYKITGQAVDLSLTQFLPPFQLFAIYEEDIRKHVSDLELECQNENQVTAELTSTQSSTSGPIQGSTRPATTGMGEDRASDALVSQPELKDTGNAKEGDTSASSHDSNVAGSDEIVDERYSDGLKLSGEHILEVMETCNVTRGRAAKTLKEDLSVQESIKSIQETLTSEEQQRARSHHAKLRLPEWKMLVLLLDEDLKSTLDTCSQIRAGSLTHIAYGDLIHLFNPGDIVVSSQNRRLQAYTVVTASGGRPLLLKNSSSSSDQYSFSSDRKINTEENIFLPAARHSPFTIDYWYYDFDGTSYGRISKSIVIPRFEGLKPVTLLPLYPAKFHNDGHGNIKEKLRQRGANFLELCSGHEVNHQEYDGRTLDGIPEEVDSRVIVDCQMAALAQPEHRPDTSEWMPELKTYSPTEPDEREIIEPNDVEYCGKPTCSTCSKGSKIFFNDHNLSRQRMKEHFNQRTYPERTSEIADLDPDHRLLFPPRVWGFVLRSRKWARLDIDKLKKLEDVTNKGDGFDRLILQEGYRDSVRALVETHLRDPKSGLEETKVKHEFDLVKGKGRGLIILLHGAPGVGKTSTAESVAEFTGRPLFPVTCGDIGDTAKDVESNLDRCFQLAHKWGCVLLLDEADVFLARRDKQDLKRNALVSVFLRVLEYYAGILFLTTNRVGAFDDAFKSRIHMTLYYPPLGRKPTHQVWKMNIQRTRENLTNVDIDEKKILKFADNQYKEAMKNHRGSWNGRQIRNAFQTAIALAEWEAKANKTKPKLSVDKFKQVAQASLDFDQYLATVHGGDEESRASTVRERAPHWGEAPPSSWGTAPPSSWGGAPPPNWRGAPPSRAEREPASNHREKSSRSSRKNQNHSDFDQSKKEKLKRKVTSKGEKHRERTDKTIVQSEEEISEYSDLDSDASLDSDVSLED